MAKEKVLIVEDDAGWASNYKILLENEGLELAAVPTASEALDLLKKNYYGVVILDLSLHLTDANDRTSEQVQEFLGRKVEGIQHIIVSATANLEDVQAAAYKYKAFAVIYKSQLQKDMSIFLDTVKKALSENKKQRPDFVEEAYELFTNFSERQGIEYEILKVLDPDKGTIGWLSFKEKFLKSIAPIVMHLTRNKIEFHNNYVLGLFWSRKLGTAISICLANNKMSEDVCIEAVNSWLGWAHAAGTKVAGNGIIGYIFIEPDLDPGDFLFSNNK